MKGLIVDTRPKSELIVVNEDCSVPARINTKQREGNDNERPAGMTFQDWTELKEKKIGDDGARVTMMAQIPCSILTGKVLIFLFNRT